MDPSASRVVAKLLRRADTTPLPASFPNTEIGMMTREEYLDFRNPTDKHHRSDSYLTTLGSINERYMPEGTLGDAKKTTFFTLLGEGNTNGILVQGDKIVVVLHDGTLYHDHWWDPPRLLEYRSQRNEWLRLPVTTTRKVKYVSEYVGLVSQIAARNKRQYPKVLNNLVLKGEPIQVREDGSEDPTLVILNSKGEIIAMASNEWGATLLQVVAEYQGKGLGPILGKYWYDIHPDFTSGGYTPQGKRNAEKMWMDRVREFLDRGWYTALVRRGKMTTERVREILRGLDDYHGIPNLPEDLKPSTEKPDPRFMIEPDQYFLVYDGKALEGNENEYPDEKYIYAHGFFRASEPVGMYLYSIDYDPEYRKLATAIALQMAKDMKEPLYVGKGYTDLVEWETVPGAVREGDYVHLTRDLLPIRDMARLEILRRKPLDRYGQRKNLLMEAAELKWR